MQSRRAGDQGGGGLGTALGLLTSAFAQTEFQAVQFMPLLVFPQVILGGVFMPRDNMPEVLSAVSDVLPARWCLPRARSDGAPGRLRYDRRMTAAPTAAQPSTPDVLTPEHFLEIADHTLLASGTTAEQLDAFLADAADLGVKRVCVSPSLLPAKDRGLEIVTVVGFPSGAHHADIKAAEAARAVGDGAEEIDMVVNLGLVRAGRWDDVALEIRAVRDACPGRVLKVILETASLTDEQIVGACRAAETGGADFVKTSTGFHADGGASVHAVRLMADTVGGRLGIKASGGVRTAAAVRELWNAGATRFGVSGTAAILADWDDNADADADASAAGPSAY